MDRLNPRGIVKIIIGKLAQAIELVDNPDEDFNPDIVNRLLNDTVLEASKLLSLNPNHVDSKEDIKVTLLWEDDEGNEIPEEFQIGDTKELGSIMRSLLTIKDIQFNKTVAIIPEYLQYVCTDCGASVALGSGNFVNRVPDLNDFEDKVQGGCPYPWGEYKCARCEELSLCSGYYRDQDAEGLEEWIIDFGSQIIWALDRDDAMFQAEKLIAERDIIIDQVCKVNEDDA